MASINRYYYVLKAGQNTINSSKFSNVEILGVRRGGLEMKDVTVDPVGSQFSKPFSSSIMTFDPLVPGADGDEKVWVLTRGESPPEPPPEIPVPEIIAGSIDNLTFPQTGHKITGVSYDGTPVTPGSKPGFGAFSFPVEASPPELSTCLYKIMTTGVNKTLSMTVLHNGDLSLREMRVIDSTGSNQGVVFFESGTYEITNVTIDGITECRVILN